MLFGKKKEPSAMPSQMSYEDKYKLFIDNVKRYLVSEDNIAAMTTGGDMPKTIYDKEHAIFNLLGTVYANAFTQGMRDEIDKILDNHMEVRIQIIRRIREECLAVYALCGADFVRTVTSNLIDGIVAMSGVTGKTSQALRRELETYFIKRPILWYVIIAGNAYAAAMADNARLRKQHAPAR